VVGIGCSAGGLEALRSLFTELVPDTGAAYVVVTHLPLDQPSILHELLGKMTSMPVTQVHHETAYEPNHVYVIAPGFALESTEGSIAAIQVADHERVHHPIDRFFTTLAGDFGARGIAIVLSGSGDDGSVGLRELKAQGGITIAQVPESANQAEMPRAAIDTGAVDLVLAPDGIARELPAIVRHSYVRQAIPRRSAQPDAVEEELERIFAILREHTGVDFANYKPPTIRRRLHRRMAIQRVDDMHRYVRLLEESPTEVHALFRDILIHVTEFFRDPPAFALLRTKVFPELIRRSSDPIRIWVPGCATGEEAYSIGIAMFEALENVDENRSVSIFATDLSEAAIEHARTGMYSQNITHHVSEERLRRFFVRTDGHYRIAKTIRDLCVFARQDITRDPPFSRLDLVVCRNVLIYLGTYLQNRLIAVFHYALRHDGYLLLGSSETVGSNNDLFDLVEKKQRLYVRRPGLPRGHAVSVDHASIAAAGQPQLPGPRWRPAELGTIDRYLVERFAPAGVVVDDDLTILEIRGKTGRFLELPTGAASLNLLRMAREGLAPALRKAIADARDSRAPLRADAMVSDGGRTHPVAIEVVPFAPGGPRQRTYLVLFRDETEGAPPPPRIEPAAGGERTDAEERVIILERERAAAREYMQSVISDLEAANEELQSANEEILSSNEELQSTNEELDTAKEELQSANEELNTVNEELHARNEELSRVNSDLVNLIGSVDIAIVIVDSQLRIRRFTPKAERILNLIASDVGRPIGHVRPNLDVEDLERMAATVLTDVTPQEREVEDRTGHWYSLRMRPYKNLDNRIDGVVIVLFDITESKRFENQLRRARDYAEAIVQTLRPAIIVIDAARRVRSVNASFARQFDVPAEQSEGKPIGDLGNGFWHSPEFERVLATAFGDGKLVEAVSIDWGSDGARERTVLSARRIVVGRDEESLVLCTVERSERA
jgi:two-component system CheB/CheR fusion protein